MHSGVQKCTKTRRPDCLAITFALSTSCCQFSALGGDCACAGIESNAATKSDGNKCGEHRMDGPLSVKLEDLGTVLAFADNGPHSGYRQDPTIEFVKMCRFNGS